MTPSAAEAPLRRLSRSSSVPRCTSAPAVVRASAEESERASPTTSWPAPTNSGTTADPMKPDAPVTKMRIEDLQVVDCPPRLSWARAAMSFADIRVAQPMSVPVISYDRRMGRWEPNARGRLEQAAMELYLE